MLRADVKKEILSGTVLVFIGVLLGFANAGILQPILLNPESIGILKVFTSFVTIASISAFLGFDGALVRIYPQVIDDTPKVRGFLKIMLSVLLLGSLLMVGVTLLFRNLIFTSGMEVLLPFFQILIISSIAKVLFLHADSLLVQYKKTRVGIFSQDIFQRILIIISLSLFYFGLVNTSELVVFYGASLSIPTLLVLFKAIKVLHVEGVLKSTKHFERVSLKEVFNTSYYGYLASISSFFLREIDFIMITYLLTVEDTGYYTVLFFFGALVSIPSRIVVKIAAPIIGAAWKDSNIKKIEIVYVNSSQVMYLVGTISYLLLVVGMPLVLSIMPTGGEYMSFKNVAYLIGLAYLSNLAFGVNTQIISTSSYYRVNLYFNLILLVCLVAFNFTLIPVYGVVGCALGTFLSLFLNNIIRFLFIRKRFRISPFTHFQLRLSIIFASLLMLYFGVNYFFEFSLVNQGLFGIAVVIIMLLSLKVFKLVESVQDLKKLASLVN